MRILGPSTMSRNEMTSMQTRTYKSISYIYLLLVPIITAAIGFGVGKVSFWIYLPIWLLNVALMIISSWSLGLNVIQLNNNEESKLAKTAFSLIIPWILISMFAGLGPPPDTWSEWTVTSKEQQVRYFLLVISGVFIVFGFAGLKDLLQQKGENFYSQLALNAIYIAVPLFTINMLYWGFYLTELFKLQATTNAAHLPEWFLPIRQLFGLVSVTEVALTYLATFLIVLALRNVGLLSKTSSLFYLLFSLLAFMIVILSAFFSNTVQTAGFVVSIPAFPFLMPYFIGVNLLRKD